jgi:glycosyltransferase involved in cell wall biosynthesis
MSQMGDSASLLWSLKMLEKNEELSLDILTGWQPNEVKDWVNERPVYMPDITKAFWKLSNFSSLSSVKDRVRIHLQLSWEEVLSKFSQAKLFTTYGRLFGGPPIEAAMHGIPFVGSGKTGALCDCAEYLHVNSETYTTSGEPGACTVLEKLYSDRDFYTKVGNAYREYVKEHYTYDSFNRNLNSILKNKNLL